MGMPTAHVAAIWRNICKCVSVCLSVFLDLLDISRYVSIAQSIPTWFTMRKLDSTCLNIVRSISISFRRFKMSHMFLDVSLSLIVFLSDSVYFNMFQYVSVCLRVDSQNSPRVYSRVSYVSISISSLRS
jgi:hypothetical protein